MNSFNTSTPTLVETWFVPFDLLMIIFLIVPTALNCIFLLIIILNYQCHTVPMMLVGNTCFAQLLLTINELFQNIVTLQHDLQYIHQQDSLCAFRGYIFYVSVSMMNVSFLLQASYRFMTVMFFTRLFWQSPRTQLALICAAWTFCFLYPLSYLIIGDIVYDTYSQRCQIPLGFYFSVILLAICTYTFPVLSTIFLYFRLVLYVKAISSHVTPANVLSRAQRELKMVRQTVILVSILVTLGIPYFIFAWTSFFTNPPKHHFRIAFIFIDSALPCLSITLLYFTDSLKASLKKLLRRRGNTVVAGVI